MLFDKNVPEPLRLSFSAHSVSTAVELGWGTLENGDLLNAAEAVGFGLMVTADQNIRYQRRTCSNGRESNFDDWAANYAEATTKLEYAVDGSTIQPKTSLSTFVNVPELRQLWRSLPMS